MIIKRTVTNINGSLVYTALQEHPSHASAAGRLQVLLKDSVIVSKMSNPMVTVVKSGDELFEFEVCDEF